jgi:hypothetical protein
MDEAHTEQARSRHERTGPGGEQPRPDGRLLDGALIEEAAKKSALVWVRGPQGAARALWHVWHDGAVWVVGGPGEQPLDGLELTDGGSATVSVRSKDKGARLVTWPATVGEVEPRGERWTAAVEELRGKRLNAPDADRLVDRWAAECRLLRLVPSGPPAELPDTSQSAVPIATPATTRGPLPTGLPARRRRL